MISVSGLSRSYGSVRAVDNVTFTLAPGSLCGLLGPNGAGKSTLFKVLAGLLEPDAGRLTRDGQPVPFGHLELKRNLGYVPEVELLDDYLTVEEFLEFIAAIRDVPAGERAGRIDRWIAFFDLGDKRKALLLECSLSMRRKTSLAAAFLARPGLLLLDEAMNGLDPESRARLKDELRRQAAEGVTILFSTHVIETVETLCDRVLMMAEGRIVADLTSAEWQGESGSLERIFLEIMSASSV